MRFILAVLLICKPLGLFSQQITLTSEYRNDVADFNENKSSFYRGRIRLRFKDTYDLFITKVKNNKNEASQSYGFSLGSKESWLFLYAGHYYINFGTGIVLGRRRYNTPDPFKSRRDPGYSRWLAPDRSGNPTYSLHGGAMGFCYSNQMMELTCNGFYSRRQRFADPEEIQNENLGSSINTITGHTKIYNDFTEALYIQDRGGLIELILYDVLTAQSYILETSLLDASGMKLYWDYNSEKDRGTECVLPYGIFVLYKDDTLQVFYDYVQILSRYRFKDGCSTAERAEGWRGGFHIKHDRFIMKSWIQHSERNFYTPYGNEGTTPREIYSTSGAVKVVESIHCGLNANSEKTLVPPANQSSNIVSQKKELFFSIKKKKYIIEYYYKDIYREMHSNSETSHQDKVKLTFKVGEYWILGFKGVLQGATALKYAHSSQGLECLIEIKDDTLFSIKAAYGYYRIAEDKSMYINPSPMANAIASGQWLDSSAHSYAGKIKVGLEKIRVEGRYTIQVIKHRPIEHQVDFAAQYQI